MTYPIQFLEVSNFRNITQLTLPTFGSINLITGNNGCGKTSLLEAIYFLGTAKSFRTAYSEKIIQHGKNNFLLFGKVKHTEQSRQHSIGIYREKGGMTVKLDGKLLKSSTPLAKIVPVKLINPDVHKIFEEGPRYRRYFLDWGVFHVEPEYATTWQTYRKVLAQRNAALRSGLSKVQISAWDTQLHTTVEKIDRWRRSYLTVLANEVCLLIQSYDTPIEIDFKWYSGWHSNLSYQEALQDTWQKDQALGYTHIGPHKSDIKILTGGKTAREIISRGQQKFLSMIMNLAQLNIQNRMNTNKASVLLVDDLPAELDEENKRKLFHAVQTTGSQVFITAIDENTNIVKSIKQESLQRFHVEQGNIKIL